MDARRNERNAAAEKSVEVAREAADEALLAALAMQQREGRAARRSRVTGHTGHTGVHAAFEIALSDYSSSDPFL